MLAEKAGVSRPTVVDFEREARNPMRQNLEALRRCFEVAGLEFIDRNGHGRGVRFHQPDGDELEDAG